MNNDHLNPEEQTPQGLPDMEQIMETIKKKMEQKAREQEFSSLFVLDDAHKKKSEWNSIKFGPIEQLIYHLQQSRDLVPGSFFCKL